MRQGRAIFRNLCHQHSASYEYQRCLTETTYCRISQHFDPYQDKSGRASPCSHQFPTEINEARYVGAGPDKQVHRKARVFHREGSQRAGKSSSRGQLILKGWLRYFYLHPCYMYITAAPWFGLSPAHSPWTCLMAWTFGWTWPWSLCWTPGPWPERPLPCWPCYHLGSSSPRCFPTPTIFNSNAENTSSYPNMWGIWD